MSTTFEGYVCWKPERAEVVMNTEALQPRNEVFLATHHPMRMYRQELRRRDVRVPYDQAAFLRDFLAPAGFAFVPVLGGSGTGKSHLVRWLWLNLPDTADRRVVLIPRTGTNLRGVVELIIGDLEGDVFDRYRDRLRRATNALSVAQARHVLLDNLALSVGPDGGQDRTDGPGVAPEVRDARRHLREYIPALLRDQFFRERLLVEGGIVDQLARHAVGSVETVERRDSRRHFAVGDFPLSITELDNLGAAARRIYIELGDPWLLEIAVEWLNLHLEEATGRLLQLGGADLTNLMREVRASLAQRGMELVLLIEDFALLQGIERQLLDALLEQPNQPDRTLCALRTALACTSSYFDKVEDTVRQRTTFVVDLDRETGADGVVTERDFEQFAARYLNAVRLGEEELQEWYQSRSDGGDDRPPPNACATCDHASVCHEAFGSEGGMGLYPFNRTALAEMYRRVGAQGFSPRHLIADVLRPTVEKYAGELARGAFPPPALIAAYNGSRLGAAMRLQIAEREDPASRARREVFQELWAGGRLGDIHPGVHTAFGLKRFGENGPVQDSGQPVRAGTPSPAPPLQVSAVVRDPVALSPRTEDALAALDRWQNGEPLPQTVVNDLRELVYPAVANRIDWTGEVLIRAEFASPTGSTPFRQTSINFQNQATQHKKSAVQLTLPHPESALTDTVLALQGLLLFDHHGNWKFDWQLSGARYQRAAANAVDQWAKVVLDQIHRSHQADGAWDPVSAAVELLALESRMSGNLSPLRPSSEELVDALFAPAPREPGAGRAPAWAELAKSLAAQREPLLAIVRSRVGVAKGAEREPRVVDAARLVKPLAAIASSWRPHESVPEDAPFDAVRKARAAADRLLDQAVAQERDRQLSVFDSVVARLGTRQHRDAAEAVRSAMARARQGGVFSGSPEALDSAVQAFRSSAFVAWAEDMERLRGETDHRNALGVLSQTHARAAAAAELFVEASDAFLSAAERRLRTETEQLEAGAGRDLATTLTGIETALQGLAAATAAIRGDAA